MQTHRLIFSPDLDEYKKRIDWDILDDDLRSSAMSFFDKYDKSQGPVACWQFCTVEKTGDYCSIDGRKFSGRAFSVLEDRQTVAVYLASCGSLDLNSYSDPLESFFSETLKRIACDMSLEYCQEQVSKVLGSELCSINPGSGDSDVWPFVQLKDLFGFFENKNIPVSIMQSGFMFPSKTVAGVYFRNENGFFNCQWCSRLNCPDRKFC